MQDNKAILTPDGTYHIFNRANGNDKLFINDNNYRYFLKRYKEYIAPIADTFCYCLMPNHFHFLVQIKDENVLKVFFEDALKSPSQGSQDQTGFQNLSGLEKLVSKQFSNFLNAYSKAFNKQQERNGSLFARPFKRKLITDDDYLRQLVLYIHHNPIEAGLAPTPEAWDYSSYRAIISNSPTLLNRNYTISLFDDLNNFIYCHLTPLNKTPIDY